MSTLDRWSTVTSGPRTGSGSSPSAHRQGRPGGVAERRVPVGPGARVMPGMTRLRVVEGISALSQPDVAAEVRAFLSRHPLPEAARSVQQNLEAGRQRPTPPARDAGGQEYFSGIPRLRQQAHICSGEGNRAGRGQMAPFAVLVFGTGIWKEGSPGVAGSSMSRYLIPRAGYLRPGLRPGCLQLDGGARLESLAFWAVSGSAPSRDMAGAPSAGPWPPCGRGW